MIDISPLLISATIIALGFALIHTIIDTRKLRTSRRIYRLLIEKVRRQNAKSFTVLIELARSMETIIPLLDDLYSHGYSKLQVIVLVKQTAGSRAESKLASYRRARKLTGLRIIKHKKGMDPHTVLRRYGTGQLNVQLEADDRIGRDFFTQASLVFLDKRLGILSPRTQTHLDNTIASALQATVSIWTDLKYSVWSPQVTPGVISRRVIYKRSAILADVSTQQSTAYAYTTFITRPALSHRRFIEWYLAQLNRLHILVQFGCLVLIASAVVLSSLLGDDLPLILILILAAYVLSYILLLLPIKGYSLMDRLNLILFAPLGLPYFLAMNILGILFSFSRRLYSQFK